MYVLLLSLAAFLIPRLTTPFNAPIVDYYGLSENGKYVLSPSQEIVNWPTPKLAPSAATLSLKVAPL